MRALALWIIAALVATPASAQAPQKLIVGDVSPLAASWPALIAQDEGFFADEKLEVEFVYTGGTTAVIQQLVGGSLDIASTSFETAIRAIDGGAPIALVGSGMLLLPYSVMAAPSIRSAADMKGKSIMLAYAQNANSVFWRRWLTENGATPADVDEVFDGSTTNRYRALAAGSVQAALLLQPFDIVAADAGYRKLVSIGSYAPTFGFTAYAARRIWLDEHGEAVRAFLRAHKRAVAFFYDIAKRDECVAILVKETKIDPAIAAKNYDLYQNTRPFNPSATIPAASVMGVLDVIRGDLHDQSAGADKYVVLKYLPE